MDTRWIWAALLPLALAGALGCDPAYYDDPCPAYYSCGGADCTCDTGPNASSTCTDPRDTSPGDPENCENKCQICE